MQFTRTDDRGGCAGCQVPTHAHGMTKTSLQRSPISSWLTGVGPEDRSPERHALDPITQTIHAPLENFDRTWRTKDTPLQGQQHQQQASSEAGLFCLERPVPEKILRGLEYVCAKANPFEIIVLRAGVIQGFDGDDEEGWLDTLMAGVSMLGSSNSQSIEEEHFGLEREQEYSRDEGHLPDNTERRKNTARTAPQQDSTVDDEQPGFMKQQQDQHQQQFEAVAEESVRWLREDIKHLAGLFAREALALSGSPKQVSMEGGENSAAPDVTVKLEVWTKPKCPRFHTDKVPVRLICTYVGQSTEWLDGYNKWEMENNRNPPPACNQKIRGGREVQHARPGDVLIFRGQPVNSMVEGGASGVAHRSPDMLEGQRRLLLTIDVGDKTPWATALRNS